MLADVRAVVIVRAGEADQLPADHVAVAAIHRVAEEALERVLQEHREEGLGVDALQLDVAFFEAVQHLVLVRGRKFGKALAGIFVAAMLVDGLDGGAVKWAGVSLDWNPWLSSPFAQGPCMYQVWALPNGPASWSSRKCVTPASFALGHSSFGIRRSTAASMNFRSSGVKNLPLAGLTGCGNCAAEGLHGSAPLYSLASPGKTNCARDPAATVPVRKPRRLIVFLVMMLSLPNRELARLWPATRNAGKKCLNRARIFGIAAVVASPARQQ